MSKRKAYRPRHTSVPMMVNREIHKNVEPLEENLMVSMIQYGFATRKHYDYMIRIGNMMNIANQLKPSKQAKELTDLANLLSNNLFVRYEKTGKFGLDGLELMAMREFVKHYDQYWLRQTTTLYNECVAQLNDFYAELEEKRKTA